MSRTCERCGIFPRIGVSWDGDEFAELCRICRSAIENRGRGVSLSDLGGGTCDV